MVIPRVEPQEPLRLELEDFAHSIRTGEEPRSSLALGIEIVAAVELAAGVDARRGHAARAPVARRPGSRLGEPMRATETDDSMRRDRDGQPACSR